MEPDINHPNISNKLDIPQSPGLADYLQGKVGPEKIIRESALFDNLFVIPAGELSENSFRNCWKTAVSSDCLIT